ncbi:AbrB/MazE/SpoVT family DNA-binding domain-containing protein [Thermococcus sp.]|uniref:AbrB/MazE/SpoVT family DNA-binding domain-containing protein n=1 Tax=Thermococcus sp. TaxID=35749 RepID=UPI0019C78A32|nr:AbrB/MazE/SpoVT family DNA-binding domain-containing protein [Thermococcus sp.]MBC7095426.1 AbrB/MazE/SpoVT family DNA-binding domain-containing protein [Thermococcus sp.]
MIMEVKRIDSQGRIVLPKEWRKRWGNEVVLIEFEDRIEILPRRKPKLSEFFDIIEVNEIGEDVEKELLKELAGELYGKHY